MIGKIINNKYKCPSKKAAEIDSHSFSLQEVI